MRQLQLLALGVIVALAANGCGAGWPEYRDPSGFKIEHPQDWKVEKVDQRWVWAYGPDRSSFTIIYPFLSQQPTTGQRCINEVSKLLSKAIPNARIENIQQQKVQPDEVTALISYQTPQEAANSGIGGVVSSFIGGTGGSGHAVALCSVYGRSGMFYLIAAPKDKFEAEQESLVKVLKSFSFTQPERQQQKAPADSAISYVRFVDPYENAFSVDVPGGWQVQGGLNRVGPIDVRSSVALVSPDSQVRITVGDANLPPFSSPSFSMIASGLLPGTWYDPGFGNKLFVKIYLGGTDFGKEYVSQTVSQWCPGPQITDARSRPDFSDPINKMASTSGLASGIISQLDAGEVAFTCTMNGQPMQGYYFVGTSITMSATGGEFAGTWSVAYLFGYVAPQDKVDLAEAVIGRIAKSYQVNPTWARTQQGITAASSQIVSQTSNQISEIMSDSYWTRQDSQANVYRHWSNTTLGLTDVRDEQTGETWKVASGHNYYWRQEGVFGQGAVAGTQNYDRPDIDFSPLMEY